MPNGLDSLLHLTLDHTRRNSPVALARLANELLTFLKESRFLCLGELRWRKKPKDDATVKLKLYPLYVDRQPANELFHGWSRRVQFYTSHDSASFRKE
jgi:hypothetical protein